MSADLTRAEHMRWCKQRALEELDAGLPADALASLASDFRKHPATAEDKTLTMLVAMVGPSHLDSPAEMRHFIEGFAE